MFGSLNRAALENGAKKAGILRLCESGFTEILDPSYL
jgi:hypothetical protein